MAYEHILVDIEPPIATVTLNRPKVLNALSPDLIREVNVALVELDANDRVGAVVLTGGPKVFAAGADIGDMADQTAVDQLRRDQTGRWAGIAAFGKPLIAALNGYALGGGCELALMCDLIIAGDTARLGQPEINLGIIPGGFVYVNAGASLATINSLKEIASPRVLGSFALLGLFALVPVIYGRIRKSGTRDR